MFNRSPKLSLSIFLLAASAVALTACNSEPKECDAAGQASVAAILAVSSFDAATIEPAAGVVAASVASASNEHLVALGKAAKDMQAKSAAMKTVGSLPPADQPAIRKAFGDQIDVFRQALRDYNKACPADG